MLMVQFCTSFSTALAENNYEYDDDAFTPIQYVSNVQVVGFSRLYYFKIQPTCWRCLQTRKRTSRFKKPLSIRLLHRQNESCTYRK